LVEQLARIIGRTSVEKDFGAPLQSGIKSTPFLLHADEKLKTVEIINAVFRKLNLNCT
jgi:hypothetical protein